MSMAIDKAPQNRSLAEINDGGALCQVSPDLLKGMGEASRSFAKPGAAGRAADVLEGFALRY